MKRTDYTLSPRTVAKLAELRRADQQPNEASEHAPRLRYEAVMSTLEDGLTQAEAAGVLGVKQPRISYIKRRPRPTSQSVAAPRNKYAAA
jgi:hypothetical protein